MEGAGALRTGSDVNVKRTAGLTSPSPVPAPTPTLRGQRLRSAVVSCLGCTLEFSGGILEAVNMKDGTTATEQALYWRPEAPVVLITLQLTQVLGQSEDSWCKCREEGLKYSAANGGRFRCNLSWISGENGAASETPRATFFVFAVSHLRVFGDHLCPV